jgi:hypothetical protein
VALGRGESPTAAGMAQLSRRVILAVLVLVAPLVAAALCCLVATERTLAGQGWYLMGPPGERLPKDLNTNLSKWPVGSWAEVRAKLL